MYSPSDVTLAISVVTFLPGCIPEDLPGASTIECVENTVTWEFGAHFHYIPSYCGFRVE
jgi:hypothetical protein